MNYYRYQQAPNQPMYAHDHAPTPYPAAGQHAQLHQLKQQVLSTVEPFVQYGLQEAHHTSYVHAMREIAAISYLIGRGYDPGVAYQIVESWEQNEMF